MPSLPSIRWRVRRRAPMTGRLLRTAGDLVWRAAVGVVAGVALAGLALALDDLIGWSLPFEPGRVTDLLVTLTGASLTIAVFALWMRSIVVGLIAGEFHPRTVTRYLDDAFQRATAGWMIAAFTVLLTVTVAMPPEPLSTVPPLASGLAFASLVAALLGILLAIRHGATRLDTSYIIHEVADEGFRILDAHSEVPDDPRPDGRHDPVRRIDSGELGWVQHVDRWGMLGALPDGANLSLHVTPGSFVAPGQLLATVDRELEEAAATAVRAAVRVGPTRDGHSDLAFVLDELTDVVRNTAGSGGDVATAREVLGYLEALLGRVIERGLPSGHLRQDGRCLTSLAGPTVADHVGRVARGLRRAADDDPEVAAVTRRMLRRLADRAEALGDVDAAAAAWWSDGDAPAVGRDGPGRPAASARGGHAAAASDDEHRRT